MVYDAYKLFKQQPVSGSDKHNDVFYNLICNTWSL